MHFVLCKCIQQCIISFFPTSDLSDLWNIFTTTTTDSNKAPKGLSKKKKKGGGLRKQAQNPTCHCGDKNDVDEYMLVV